MSDLEHRIEMGIDWLARTIAATAGARAGWGWVPDVLPNPQNTAEVVCALTLVEVEVPSALDVERLVRADVVSSAERGDWAFRALIDVAWRLRALRAMGAPAADKDVRACIGALLSAQEPETGGWRFAGHAGPVSVTATVAALEAIMGFATSEEEIGSVGRGVGMLISMVLADDIRMCPLAASAQIAALLAAPQVATLGGPRTDRARELAVERVASRLEQRKTPIEEETFERGSFTDSWRHMTLSMALRAVAVAAPQRIFEPGFRAGLVELVELQEVGVESVNRGGFRTSREGFVTSYATTQALEVFAAVGTTLTERVNPARTFDLLCQASGEHHSDPQEIVTIGARTVVMNSWAGLVFLLASVLGGGTTTSLAIVFADDLGHAGSRALVVWGYILIALGVFGYLSVRLPKVENRGIALAVFSGFTALVLPVLTFLVS